MRVLRDEQKAEADARLESLLLEGLASGKDAPHNQEFWREVKRQAAQTLARKNKHSPAKGNAPITTPESD
jgi:hypothetical protein